MVNDNIEPEDSVQIRALEWLTFEQSQHEEALYHSNSLIRHFLGTNSHVFDIEKIRHELLLLLLLFLLLIICCMNVFLGHVTHRVFTLLMPLQLPVKSMLQRRSCRHYRTISF